MFKNLALLRGFRIFDLEGGGGSADGAGSPPAGAGGPGTNNKPADSAATPSPGNNGSGEPSPGSAPENQNIKQLREAYDSLKKKYEPFENLGDPASVQRQVEMSRNLTKTAMDAGLALGYTEQQIRDSLEEDFVGTLNFLRRRQQEAEAGGDMQDPALNKIMKELSELRKEVDPLKRDREDRKIQQGRELFDQTFASEIKELFKGQQLTSDESDPLWEDTLNLLRDNPDAMKRLMEEGKTADIREFAKKAKDRWDRRYLARRAREEGRTDNRKSGKGDEQNAGDDGKGGNKFTLDDVISGKKEALALFGESKQ